MSLPCAFWLQPLQRLKPVMSAVPVRPAEAREVRCTGYSNCGTAPGSHSHGKSGSVRQHTLDCGPSCRNTGIVNTASARAQLAQPEHRQLNRQKGISQDERSESAFPAAAAIGDGRQQFRRPRQQVRSARQQVRRPRQRFRRRISVSSRDENSPATSSTTELRLY
jgi:hypothetical protein